MGSLDIFNMTPLAARTILQAIRQRLYVDHSNLYAFLHQPFHNNLSNSTTSSGNHSYFLLPIPSSLLALQTPRIQRRRIEHPVNPCDQAQCKQPFECFYEPRNPPIIYQRRKPMKKAFSNCRWTLRESPKQGAGQDRIKCYLLDRSEKEGAGMFDNGRHSRIISWSLRDPILGFMWSVVECWCWREMWGESWDGPRHLIKRRSYWLAIKFYACFV